MRMTTLALGFTLLFGLSADGLWDRISTLLTGFVASSETVDVGCKLDPHGQCAPPPTTDVGCKLDPDGQCAPAPTTDVGCKLDPSGQCVPGPSADVGCKLDPNGNPICYEGS